MTQRGKNARVSSITLKRSSKRNYGDNSWRGFFRGIKFGLKNGETSELMGYGGAEDLILRDIDQKKIGKVSFEMNSM